MFQFLSQEYLDEYVRRSQEQPQRPGTSVRVQYVATEGPDGDIFYYWIVEDGHILEAKLGELSEPDFTLAMSYADLVAVEKRELDAQTAFMGGKMKVTGNMGKLISMLPLTNADEWKALQEEMRALTTF